MLARIRSAESSSGVFPVILLTVCSMKYINSLSINISGIVQFSLYHSPRKHVSKYDTKLDLAKEL